MTRELPGLINLQPEQDYLEDLTYFRSGGAVPFMGRYRLIDFTITNLANSGVGAIGVFAGNKFRSLLDHLNRKEDFGLEGRDTKIFILPPDWNDPSDISQGDLKHFHNHEDLFTRSKAKDVIVSGTKFITNRHYRKAVEIHQANDNDITFVGEQKNEDDIPDGPMLRMNTEGDTVTGFTHEQANGHLFTGVYIIKKDILMNTARYCIDNYKQSFFHDGIREKLDEYKTGFYSAEADTMYFYSIESHFKNSMALLDKDKYRDFFYGENRMKTKISTTPPTLHKKGSSVKRSILANGVEVEGTVESSVISRNACIHEGATVKNSIVFANCVIESGAYLENVILDKDVAITEGQRLMGTAEMPYIVAKRSRI